MPLSKRHGTRFGRMVYGKLSLGMGVAAGQNKTSGRSVIGQPLPPLHLFNKGVADLNFRSPFCDFGTPWWQGTDPFQFPQESEISDGTTPRPAWILKESGDQREADLKCNHQE